MTDRRKKLARFPETRWSEVRRAGSSNFVLRDEALSSLLERYRPGLLSFLTETRRLDTALAEDLLQDFIVEKVLAKQLVAKADRNRGRFRNFVLKALNNFVSTRLRQERAVADIDVATLGDDKHADKFDRQWAHRALYLALESMESECRQRGRSDLWDVMRLRLVEPILDGERPAEYGELVRQLGLQTPRQAMNLLVNAKRCFLRNLRLAVAEYVHDQEDIDVEIAELRRIVSE